MQNKYLKTKAYLTTSEKHEFFGMFFVEIFLLINVIVLKRVHFEYISVFFYKIILTVKV